MVIFWTVQMTTENVTFYFYYVCTYREVKTPILRYHTITCLGIVQFEAITPSPNKKNTITMMEPFNITAAWLWQIIQYHRGIIFVRGWPRAGCKGLFNYVNRQRNFIFSELIILLYKPIGASPRRDYVVTRIVLVRIE
jgi:hypothetical protein